MMGAFWAEEVMSKQPQKVSFWTSFHWQFCIVRSWEFLGDGKFGGGGYDLQLYQDCYQI